MATNSSTTHFWQDGRVRLRFPTSVHRFEKDKSNNERAIKRKHGKITFGTTTQQCERLQPFAGVPRMNITILITGSRGDVQPFIALGKELQAAPYNHRVRIGTHGVFRDFVGENGLEFFSIGGDPERLMAYMVKNPGILPSIESVKAGDIGARKAELEEMLIGAWKACTEARDQYQARHSEERHYPAFVADAIISNPPTYASLHIAERLAIPLHYMFTMPWSPTTAYPHPLAQMDSSRTDAGVRNYLSYTQIELLTWTGLIDIINRFRRRTLLLEPINPSWGTNLQSRLKVPFTYCWSPALIPKPADWGSDIGISGFFFLPKASSYKPDSELQAFLDAGEPPIYIGFGSIVVDKPEEFTKLILEAVKKSGVRALVSRGWSNVGGNDVPDNVYLLGNVPHDWLFRHVSAVVHHGGAGTCAIGLALGRPTVIVPFFGDQFWWAGIVSRAGAGPQAVPYKELTADKLADNIKKALEPDVKAKARELSEKMKGENGVKTAAEQFHTMQRAQSFACFLCPDRTAVWRVRRTNIQLSALATAILTKHKKLTPRDIKLMRHKRWYVEEGAPGPVSGLIAAVHDPAVNSISDIQDFKRSITARSKWSKGLAVKEDSASSLEPEDAISTGAALARLGRNLAEEAAIVPVTFFYQVANGFHNLPARLFHDRTVRMRDPIVNAATGMKVAGKEIVFGLYDGVSGIVMQPLHGYQEGAGRKGGVAWGTAKGVGRGVTGVVTRVGAMAFGIPGYTLKGMEMQFRRKGINTDQLAEVDVPEYLKKPSEGAYKERRTQVQKDWAEVSAGHPILQRRIMQAVEELYEVMENDPGFIDAVLERWEALRSLNELAF